jgi:hypothetical protein
MSTVMQKFSERDCVVLGNWEIHTYMIDMPFGFRVRKTDSLINLLIFTSSGSIMLFIGGLYSRGFAGTRVVCRYSVCLVWIPTVLCI